MKRKTRQAASRLEEEFALLIRDEGLPAAVREHQAVPGRRFRVDFAWPDRRVCVELQGGIWKGKSAHNTGTGLLRDYEKHNELQLAGWLALQFGPNAVRGSGWAKTLDTLVRALGLRTPEEAA